MLLILIVLHGGDSDSTGAVVCAWYGALNGFAGVPDTHYKVKKT